MLSALSGEKGGHFKCLSIVTMAKLKAQMTSCVTRNMKVLGFSERWEAITQNSYFPQLSAK